MKKALFICSLLICVAAFAQHPGKGKHRHGNHDMERPDYSPEQIAELQTKKLTLLLDLSDAQQQKVTQLELEAAQSRKARMEERKKGEELSDDERFQRHSAMLDTQIAHKKSMKSILNKDQYEKWEKALISKGKERRGRRAHSRKG